MDVIFQCWPNDFYLWFYRIKIKNSRKNENNTPTVGTREKQRITKKIAINPSVDSRYFVGIIKTKHCLHIIRFYLWNSSAWRAFVWSKITTWSNWKRVNWNQFLGSLLWFDSLLLSSNEASAAGQAIHRNKRTEWYIHYCFC